MASRRTSRGKRRQCFCLSRWQTQAERCRHRSAEGRETGQHVRGSACGDAAQQGAFVKRVVFVLCCVVCLFLSVPRIRQELPDRETCYSLSEPWKAELRVFLPLRVLEGSFAHNMWNPLMELLFHDQISGVFVPFVDEIELAEIALSCHFALDLLCCKDGAHDFA